MEPTSEHTALAKPAYVGRPNKNDNFKLYDGRLYKLLLAKLPSKYLKLGRLDTQAICEGTGNARYTVYCWLNEQKLSKNAVRALLKLSVGTDESKRNGKLTKADLIPFLDI